MPHACQYTLQTQITAAPLLQANTNEIVAASVVYLPAVSLDRPLPAAAWASGRCLRHFSVVRKLNGLPFPAGARALTMPRPAQTKFAALLSRCVCLRHSTDQPSRAPRVHPHWLFSNSNFLLACPHK